MTELLKQLMSRWLFFWAGLLLHERRPRIIGVTGSVGKTTTKEAIATVLMDERVRPLLGLVEKSADSLNSELGLPLAVLRFTKSPVSSVIGWFVVFVVAPLRAAMFMTIRDYPSILILEYAADRPGDITRLTKLAKPEVAVVIAVGPAHLERFGTVERVAKEKGALVRAVATTGLAILARDNSHVAAMEDLTRAQVVKVAGTGFELSKNMARVVGHYFGVHKSWMDSALKSFVSLEGRLNIHHLGKLTLIDDTYNANPLSMKLALDTLQELKKKSRAVAFLGAMRELGTKSEEYHREIGAYARKRADIVIGVGTPAEEYKATHWYPTSIEAAAHVSELIEPGDTLLVKGSRSVAMEHVVRAVRAHIKE